MTSFLVKRDDLRTCRVDDAEAEPGAPGPGEALLEVHSFGLTANNITYAVMGEAMSYWGFFPAPEGWGRVPMWGFADVKQSEVEGLEPGTRVYGYLPPSSHLVVAPGRVDAGGFSDAIAHRAALPPIYQRYTRTDTDPLYRPETEALQVLMRPLFFTSFLIDDQLDDDGLTAQGPIIISSASSKTAIGAAFLLAQREGVEVIGLTSARSSAFVEGLGIYARTVTYDAIDTLERGPAAFVDIAGDGAVSLAVHTHFGDALTRSMTVGITHWEALGAGGGAELPGPAPAFFFAPDRVDKRSEDWGTTELAQRVAAAWHAFCEWAGGWLTVEHGEGFDAVSDAYLEVLEGGVAPDRAHVLSV
jgi:NADPH:quinone reductase-like Zn-dependent oxidoreductase